MSASVCVFTAVFGGYESLNAQPQAEGSADRWLCFTDDPELVSEHWEIVAVDPAFPLDPHRSSRQVKMLGHPLVREHERSLWIDNSVVLERPPQALLDEWLASADIAFCVHSYRETVLDEFLAVLDDSLDDPGRILEQLDHYARSMPEVLDQRPLWGALIARRWTPDVDRAMETWWQHLLRYSRRDQLSLIAALMTTGLAVERIVVDNFSSPWHRWPIIPDRNGTMRQVKDRARPPMADLLIAQRRLAEALDRTAALSDDIAELEAERHRLEQERQRVESERDQLGVQLDDVEGRAEKLDHGLAAQSAELVELRERAQALEDQRASMAAAVDQLVLEWTDLRNQLDAIETSRSWLIARGLSRVLHPVQARRGRQS
jgi:hypothetical protein